MSASLPFGAAKRGFTLVELLITMAIVSIVAMIAIPAYTQYVAKARRADAQSALVAFAGAMERHFANNASYLGAAGTDASPADTGAPRIFPKEAPLDGSTKYYDLVIKSATQTTFLLYAIPKGAQAKDQCGTLTIDHAGNRDVVGASGGLTAADCWR